MPTTMTSDIRFVRAASDPLADTVLSTIQRGLIRKGAPPKTALDRIFDAVMARHPGFNPTIFQPMIDEYAKPMSTSRELVT